MGIGKIFSIGYAGFHNDVSTFCNELMERHVNVIIDVRSSPYSAYFDAFDKEKLERSLKLQGIYYRNYAREFGARQENRVFYPNGYLDFKLFAQSEQFLEGIDRVTTSISRGYRVALMCAEKEPSACHRTILVSRELAKLGYFVEHILPDGKSKTQDDIDRELLKKYHIDPNQVSFFAEEDPLEIVYRKQNEEIGYKMEDNG